MKLRLSIVVAALVASCIYPLCFAYADDESMNSNSTNNTRRQFLATVQDQNKPNADRYLALRNLMEKYAPGKSVFDFCTTVHSGKWLHKDEIQVLDIVGGMIPLKASLGESIVVIRPRFIPKTEAGIYLRLSKRVSDESARKMFCGTYVLGKDIVIEEVKGG